MRFYHFFILLLIGSVGLMSFGCISAERKFQQAGGPTQPNEKRMSAEEERQLLEKTNALFVMGLRAEEKGDLKEAEWAYQNCVQFTEKKNSSKYLGPPYHRLAVIAARNRNIEKSEEYFRKALKNSNTNVELVCDFAQMLCDEQRSHEAATILDNALIALPKNKKLLFFLGHTLAVQNREIEAIRHLKTSIGEADAYFEVAEVLREKGNQRGADVLSEKGRLAQSKQRKPLDDFKDELQLEFDEGNEMPELLAYNSRTLKIGSINQRYNKFFKPQHDLSNQNQGEMLATQNAPMTPPQEMYPAPQLATAQPPMMSQHPFMPQPPTIQPAPQLATAQPPMMPQQMSMPQPPVMMPQQAERPPYIAAAPNSNMVPDDPFPGSMIPGNIVPENIDPGTWTHETFAQGPIMERPPASPEVPAMPKESAFLDVPRNSPSPSPPLPKWELGKTQLAPPNQGLVFPPEPVSTNSETPFHAYDDHGINIRGINDLGNNVEIEPLSDSNGRIVENAPVNESENQEWVPKLTERPKTAKGWNNYDPFAPPSEISEQDSTPLQLSRPQEPKIAMNPSFFDKDEANNDFTHGFKLLENSNPQDVAHLESNPLGHIVPQLQQTTPLEPAPLEPSHRKPHSLEPMPDWEDFNTIPEPADPMELPEEFFDASAKKSFSPSQPVPVQQTPIPKTAAQEKRTPVANVQSNSGRDEKVTPETIVSPGKVSTPSKVATGGNQNPSAPPANGKTEKSVAKNETGPKPSIPKVSASKSSASKTTTQKTVTPKRKQPQRTQPGTLQPTLNRNAKIDKPAEQLLIAEQPLQKPLNEIPKESQSGTHVTYANPAPQQTTPVVPPAGQWVAAGQNITPQDLSNPLMKTAVAPAPASIPGPVESTRIEISEPRSNVVQGNQTPQQKPELRDKISDNLFADNDVPQKTTGIMIAEQKIDVHPMTAPVAKSEKPEPPVRTNATPQARNPAQRLEKTVSQKQTTDTERPIGKIAQKQQQPINRQKVFSAIPEHKNISDVTTQQKPDEKIVHKTLSKENRSAVKLAPLNETKPVFDEQGLRLALNSPAAVESQDQALRIDVAEKNEPVIRRNAEQRPEINEAKIVLLDHPSISEEPPILMSKTSKSNEMKNAATVRFSEDTPSLHSTNDPLALRIGDTDAKNALQKSVSFGNNVSIDTSTTKTPEEKMISLNGRSGVFLRTKDHSIRETTPSRIDSVIKINPEKAPEESVKPRIHSESENVQKSSPAKSSGEIRLVGNESEISDSAPTARYQQCQWNTAHAVTAVPPTPSPYGNLVDGIISLNLFYR